MKRFVWNYHNRVMRTLSVTDGTDSWTYTTAAYQQANASAANQVAVVVGVAEVALSIQLSAHAANATPTAVIVAIGLDGLSPASGTLIGQRTSGGGVTDPSSSLRTFPAIGYHYYTWLEYSGATGTTTWYGDNGSASLLQSGMHGTIEG